MRVLLTLLFATLMAPPAAADDACLPADAACVSEYGYASGDCDAGEGYASRWTMVHAGPVSGGGSSECYRYGGYGSTRSGAEADAAGVGVTWMESATYDPESGRSSSCAFVAAGRTADCPTSPPDPGWGSLLS